MKDKNLIGSIVVALAIVIAGLALRSGMVTFKDRDRVVSVKGLAEREVKADKVTWPLRYVEMGNDPMAIYEALERKNDIIRRFLHQGGIKDAEISITPPAVTDRQANDYGDMSQLARYKASSVITVTSSNVDLVRDLLKRQSELMKQGVALVAQDYGENGVTYEFTGLNGIKPEMVEEATKNARTTAEKFAADSESKIGKISRASQGQFSIEDRDATTPYIKNVRVVITMDYLLED